MDLADAGSIHVPEQGQRMAYLLTRDEPWDEGLRRVATEEIEAALDGLRGRDGDNFDEVVHDARKRCKKVRAVARLGRDVLGDDFDRINATFREAARALSAVRDAKVHLETLDALAAHTDRAIPTEAFDLVRESLRARHRSVRQGVMEGSAVDEVVAALAAVRVHSWPLDGARWSGLAGGLARVYRRGRRRVPAIGGTAEAWHDWRKRVKYLWYHLRLLQEALPPVLKPWVDELDVLSDLTGGEHDLALLHATLCDGSVGAGPGGSPGGQPAAELVRDLIPRRRDRLRAQALRLGSSIYAQRTRPFVNRVGVGVTAWRTTARLQSPLS